MRIYFDESGFTGEDLANVDQQVFILASTQADKSECESIFKRVFDGIQAPELKHSTLARSPKGRERVLSFFQAIRGSRLFTSWVVHKQFCLLTKLVDLWLEPALFEDGIDFYKDGANRAFSNMAWFCLRTFESPEFLSQQLVVFQEMVRTRTKGTYDTFWSGLDAAAHSSKNQTREILSYFLLAEKRLGYERMLVMPERMLDICLTSALQTIGFWRGQTTEDLAVIHDSSSNMAREKWMWDAMTSHNFPPFRVGPSDFLVEYPLRVTDTQFEDSSEHLQLQFADIVAGATADWARSRFDRGKKDEYAHALQEAGIMEHLIGGIWPVPDVEPRTTAPGAVGAQEYIAMAARTITNARKEL